MNMGTFHLKNVKVIWVSFSVIFSKSARNLKGFSQNATDKSQALAFHGDCIWGILASNLSGSSGVLIYQNISKMTDHIVEAVKNRALRGVCGMHMGNLTLNICRLFWGHSVHFSTKLFCYFKTCHRRVKRMKVWASCGFVQLTTVLSNMSSSF